MTYLGVRQNNLSRLNFKVKLIEVEFIFSPNSEIFSLTFEQLAAFHSEVLEIKQAVSHGHAAGSKQTLPHRTF